ncbi:hypothetical protein FACS1894203_5410 [Bacteroidia bacterium]|nr:hypothetical protein FACS1894203_5410 [Bacteroidia bacterium]GHU90685.1 hypothetical protein FACS1894155_09350 [Bacteroidia bacterium]
MKQKGRQPKGKLIKPTFFVFCEGETEETYVKHLRSLYRLPIEIDPKIAGNRITDKYIANHKNHKTVHPKDKTFLIYDSDVKVVLEKLKKIKNAYLLCSNPCFELWYLLHFANQNAELTSGECVSKLINNVRHYQKGNLDDKLKEKLCENKAEAIKRAQSLPNFNNPSTSIYKFVEELDKIAK